MDGEGTEGRIEGKEVIMRRRGEDRNPVYCDLGSGRKDDEGKVDDGSPFYCYLGMGVN